MFKPSNIFNIKVLRSYANNTNYDFIQVFSITIPTNVNDNLKYPLLQVLLEARGETRRKGFKNNSSGCRNYTKGLVHPGKELGSS